MSRSARHTKLAYRFDQVMRPMPTRLIKDRSIGTLRNLAGVVARWEAPDRAHRLEVVAGRGLPASVGGFTSYCAGNRIELARHQRSLIVLLHELAHWLTPPSRIDHGPSFMRTYMRLLHRYAGMRRYHLNEAWRVAVGTHYWVD